MITETILSVSCTRFPEKKAIVTDSKWITYKELDERSDNLAVLLREHGVKRGDRVGVYLPKSIEEAISIFSVVKAGGVFVLLNPVLRESQVEYITNDCGIKILISNSLKLRNIDCEGNGFSSISRIFLFDETLEPALKIRSQKLLSVHGLLESSKRCLIETSCIPSDLATIIYTSGCTGSPKGIMTTHQNLMEGADIISNYLNMNSDDTVLSILPFSFDYGLDQLLTTIKVGGTIVLHDFLFPEEILKTIEDQKITGVAGVPVIWNRIVEMHDKRAHHNFSHLRYITNSGGKLSVQTTFRLVELFPETKLYLMYGLTEAHRSTYLDPSLVKSRPDSIGKAIPNVEIYILDKEDMPCKPGEIGELVHRGALISLGYWNDPVKTDEVFRQNPLKPKETLRSEKVVYSGDLVKSDEEGFLYYVGRRDEMIKRLGYRVSPAEVEEALLSMGKFSCVVAVGVEQENLEQDILCYVIVKKGVTCSQKEVVHFLRGTIPSYMIPREILFKETIPHTPNGKIDRALLRKEASWYVKEQRSACSDDSRTVRCC
ncbi:MAG: acyl-CoA ligase (AMP-forming), exosortase A system-associated [Candidatus Scalindua sp. AMX11]|nr:MAG: acyl-CoA ligase (AMP-forming), exosortase A system-associated [Candidatus Scalindua sp.]NOG84388.1 acyl-CoA ligase (AMP-forming), exosortase A system-associated [Planctomycetota bacterium]RZV65761.1 MAG: acyl-CoA ligase (AMP-forming), exosortase A system-associated [Candidatus Scalindua sp. SCAELEC01]TDE65389.1 MAG: acyl-CoA ligase (AMP-forming), exosortase A system-associated [Candidatus Scalindua sp. AMX11]GJQ60338.1 MAG: AMP-dependent synthetase [Candidatus Scalindua sp.]